MKLLISNSFTTVIEATAEVKSLITELTTYQNDHDAEIAQLFYQVKLAKRINNKKMYHAALGRIKYLEANKTVCLFKENRFPTGLLNLIVAGLDDFRATYKVVDERVKPEPNVILRWKTKPFEMRYYQKEMVRLGVEACRGVFSACVGSGKSLALGNLIKELSVRSLVVVPSSALSGQLYADMVQWFGADKVELVDAKKVRAAKSIKPISIITVQSLASLNKTGDVQKLVKDVDALFIDEFHHVGSDTWSALQPAFDHIYYKYGFTGTFLRSNRTLEMWGMLSNVIYEYGARKAIVEGYLTPLSVVVHSMTGKPNRKFQKEYDLAYSGNPELLEKVRSIVEDSNPNDPVLILVSKKDKCGKIIYEYLQMMGVECNYISGDDTKEIINRTISDFNDLKVRVLIGSSVIGEGVNVTAATHLINCVGLKSETVLVQAVGRCVRLFEGKKMAYVHDFDFEGAKFMERHLKIRLQVYEDTFGATIESI